jgi:hypothetical protein
MEEEPMDDLPTVPRPLALVAGALVLVPGFLLAWAAIGIPLGLGWTTATALMSAISVGGAALCLSASWRLLLDRHRKDGGLVSVPFLKASALLFGAMPILAVATGSWRSVDLPGWLLVVQGFGYFGSAAVLLRLAARRSRQDGSRAAGS